MEKMYQCIKMLRTLFYFLILLHCGFGLTRLEWLDTAEVEAWRHMRQCLEDGDYCWDPEECCTGPNYEDYFLGADFFIKGSAVIIGLPRPPLCSGSAARSLSARWAVWHVTRDMWWLQGEDMWCKAHRPQSIENFWKNGLLGDLYLHLVDILSCSEQLILNYLDWPFLRNCIFKHFQWKTGSLFCRFWRFLPLITISYDTFKLRKCFHKIARW